MSHLSEPIVGYAMRQIKGADDVQLRQLLLSLTDRPTLEAWRRHVVGRVRDELVRRGQELPAGVAEFRPLDKETTGEGGSPP